MTRIDGEAVVIPWSLLEETVQALEGYVNYAAPEGYCGPDKGSPIQANRVLSRLKEIAIDKRWHDVLLQLPEGMRLVTGDERKEEDV